MQRVAQRVMVSSEVAISRRVAEGHFVLTLRVGRTFESSQPGQFVMIKAKGTTEPFLPRPISIYDTRNEGGEIFLDLLIRIVGRGTLFLSRLRSGDKVQLLGPLGKGFRIEPRKGNHVLVAGGIGIAPLAFLADHLSRNREGGGGGGELVCYIGARSADSLCCLDRLERSCTSVHISTDDGSLGFRGVVMDLFARDLKRYHEIGASFYACGPWLMIKRIQTVMKRAPSVCQVSVEERMACGVGACLGCAIKKRDGAYGRVCVDGPVFDLNDLEFD